MDRLRVIDWERDTVRLELNESTSITIDTRTASQLLHHLDQWEESHQDAERLRRVVDEESR